MGLFGFLLLSLQSNSEIPFTHLLKPNNNMEKKRILIVTQEMDPYLAITEASKIANELPKYMQDNGMEIRVLMPKFGTINERRHRLHEVVRLSGINVIINDEDYPLVIKVDVILNLIDCLLKTLFLIYTLFCTILIDTIAFYPNLL